MHLYLVTISLISVNLKFYFTEFYSSIHSITMKSLSRHLEKVFHTYLLNECIQCAGTVLIAETWHI